VATRAAQHSARMGTVSGSIVVDCSPEEAFAYSGEPAHGPEWQAGLRATEMETPGPPRLGVRVRERRGLPGAPASRWELTHYQPGARWSLRRIDRGTSARRTMTFTALDGGAATRLSLELAFDGTGVAGLSAAVAKHRAARQIQADLARLKRRLEGRAPGA
jgi:hypothetical protein